MKAIKNPPSPNILVNSMRSIGYSFSTALADILDNSVSAEAKHIYIFTPISDDINDEIAISILDDGHGMSNEELFNAMTYGSNRTYSKDDLGKFGLGLKSASLSQCRKLTVVSKKDNNINSYCWDLDIIENTKDWSCCQLEADEIAKLPNINDLKELKQGTLVIWQNFDFIEKKSEGNTRALISQEMEDAENYISLVFHRFINNHLNPLKIYINKREIFGLDPFLENHYKTVTQPPKDIELLGSIIRVQPYILPHQSDLSDNDYKLLGGLNNLKDGQGFYIYRNKRLITYGTWLRISSNNISLELYKYGRIKVDIPNTLDDIWSIDVKKKNAVIPTAILNNLRNIVYNVQGNSKQKIERRTKIKVDEDNNRIWNKCKNLDNKTYSYYINTRSNFISDYLTSFSDEDRVKAENLLEIISNKLPIDDIYASVANNSCTAFRNTESYLNIINCGISFFKLLKSKFQISDEDIFQQMLSTEPFDNIDVINDIKEHLYGKN